MDGSNAFHLRSRVDPESGAIDAWLERHGYSTTHCADVYEAVEALSRCGDAPPSIAFVRADQLTSDEYVILTFLRETAPDAPLILYGRTIEGQLPEAAAQAYLCATSVDLAKLLDTKPADVPRPASADRGPRVEAEPRDREAETCEPDGPAAGELTTPQGYARPLLTSEELAALFGDDPAPDA